MAIKDYILTDPKGVDTSITKEQADSYSQGANTLAEGFSVRPASTKNVNVVDTNQLEQDTDINLPPATEPERFRNVTTDTRLNELDATQTNLRGQIDDAMKDMGDMSGFTTRAEEEVGLYDARQAKTAIDNQYRAKEREFDLAIREAEDAFGTRAQKNAIKAEITKNYNRELADLSIIQMARAGELSDAQAYVDRKVELELQDRQNNLNRLNFLYTENKERFTIEEQRAFESKIREEEKAYAEEMAQTTAFENFKFSLLQTAINNGKGNAVLSQIQAAKDMESLLKVPGIQVPQATGGTAKPITQLIGDTLYQYNPTTGEWVAVAGAETGAMATEQAQGTMNTLEWLLDATARIRGGTSLVDPEKNYTAEGGLYEGASPNPIMETARRWIGSSSTKNTQLNTYVDSLKTNMLTMQTDENIKKFFGPQMSEADVRMMMSAGTTLDPNNQTDAQLLAEVIRIENFLGRAYAAVQQGQNAQATCQGRLTMVFDQELQENIYVCVN